MLHSLETCAISFLDFVHMGEKNEKCGSPTFTSFRSVCYGSYISFLVETDLIASYLLGGHPLGNKWALPSLGFQHLQCCFSNLDLFFFKKKSPVVRLGQTIGHGSFYCFLVVSLT